MNPRHRYRLLTLMAASALLRIGTAEAHVEVEPRSTPPGEYQTLQLWVYHGCATSDTVQVDVKIPAGLVEVTPGYKPDWEVQMKRAKLPVPVEVYGRPVSEAVTEVSWKGGRLPAQLMDSFLVTVFVTEAASNPLRLLVTQRCEDGPPQDFAPEVEIAQAAAGGEPPETPPVASPREQSLLGWLALGLSLLAIALAISGRRKGTARAVKEIPQQQ